MASSEIEISDLNKLFGTTHVLKDVSLSIAAGSFVSILGPSGCGKSTLLRIIAGLEGATSGAISIERQRVENVSAKDRGIAFVFQTYALYPHLSAYGNIAAPLVMRELTAWQRLPWADRLHGPTKRHAADIHRRVMDTAKLLSIEAMLQRKPGQMSGGQRQRVALGRALVREPKLFLMDEPLANLDAGLRVHMRTEIGEMQRRLGATTLFVTHDQAEAFAMSDKVAVMFGGEIRQFDVPRQLYSKPADIDVARFLSQPYLNVLTTHVAENGMVAIGDRQLKIDAAKNHVGEGTLAFRPEHVALAREGDPEALLGTVDHVEYGGSDSHVFVRCAPFEQSITVRIDSTTSPHLRAGDACAIRIDGAQAWIFAPSGKRIADADILA